MTATVKHVVYACLTVLAIVFLFGYVFTQHYLKPSMVDNAVSKVQSTIDSNYNSQMSDINSKISAVDGKIANVERKRQKNEKDVADLKKKRAEAKPTATADEAIKTLKEMGYEVIIIKK